MYVCLCNGLTDAQVAQAVAAGASRLKEIYAACACRAQCGRCARMLNGMLRAGCCREHGSATLPPARD